MQFGIQFFPDVDPEQKSAAQYFQESIALCELADRLGYTHARTVEHYFHPYGGYSTNPIVFLTAIAMRTTAMRLITGAIVPAFNNPLKIAGEIGMLDAISNGRLDVGFARAFLPHEFRRFGVNPDESVDRYREAFEQIDLLLREENVSHHGRFHQFDGVTSLPRPTQRPRPRFYVAATVTPESFAWAGAQGHALMCIPFAAQKLRAMLDLYRESWRNAGHPGDGEVMLGYHMFVDEDGDRARRIAKPHVQGYFDSLFSASSEWADGFASTAYGDYATKLQRIRTTTMEQLIEAGAALIGTPAEARAALHRLESELGPFEHASMQINFHLLPFQEAARSLRLFAEDVIPAFAANPAAAG